MYVEKWFQYDEIHNKLPHSTAQDTANKIVCWSNRSFPQNVTHCNWFSKSVIYSMRSNIMDINYKCIVTQDKYNFYIESIEWMCLGGVWSEGDENCT